MKTTHTHFEDELYRRVEGRSARWESSAPEDSKRTKRLWLNRIRPAPHWDMRVGLLKVPNRMRGTCTAMFFAVLTLSIEPRYRTGCGIEPKSFSPRQYYKMWSYPQNEIGSNLDCVNSLATYPAHGIAHLAYSKLISSPTVLVGWRRKGALESFRANPKEARVFPLLVRHRQDCQSTLLHVISQRQFPPEQVADVSR